VPTDVISDSVLYGCSPVLHVAKVPNEQQAIDLQTELELDEMP
jgi:hypothetical protein